MMTYKFTALDSRGHTTEGVLDAESAEEALRQIRGKGLFPCQLKTASENREVELPRMNPSDSGESAPASSKAPEGRACEKGKIQCALLERGAFVSGSFNLWGEHGQVYIIFELDNVDTPYVKIDIEDVTLVQVSGLFSKRLILNLQGGETYVFKGNIREMKKFCDFGRFMSARKA